MKFELLKTPDSIELCWASYRMIKKGWSVQYHSHDYWQHLQVESGSVLCKVAEEYAIVREKNAILIPPPTPHNIFATDNTDMLEMKFYVHDETLNEQLGKVMPVPELISMNMMSIAKNIVTEGKYKQSYYREIASLKLLEYVLNLLRCINATDRKMLPKHYSGPEQIEINSGNDLSTKTAKYIEAHLNQNITLADIAGYLGYNPSYYCEKFATMLGITPMRFLAMLRLKRAGELISTTMLPFSNIAENVGYSSEKTLWRAFRSQFGMSPGTYRQNHSVHIAEIKFEEQFQSHYKEESAGISGQYWG